MSTSPALPETTGITSPDDYFAGVLAEGRIELQICDSCGRQVFPPRVLCPRCGSQGLAWTRISGTGVVYATTTIRQRPERGGDYNVSIVELDEGARLMSTVAGPTNDAIGIDLAVEAFIGQADDRAVVMFKPLNRGGDA